MSAAHSVTPGSTYGLRCLCESCSAARRAAHPYRSCRLRWGPDDEIDEMVVRRLMLGDRVQSQIAERTEAVRRLTEGGMSAAEIAMRVRVAQRTVTRTRARLRREGLL